jgi:hypothetical protein
VRDVQADLIAILKRGGRQEGQEGSAESKEGENEEVSAFLAEVAEKSAIL